MSSNAGATPSLSPSLLVVDDEAAIADYVAAVGTATGCETSVCTQPLSLDKHLVNMPDIIVLDLSMPGADGISVIRDLASAGCTSLLILMSGVDSRVLMSASHIATMQGLNLHGCLEKPFRKKNLKDQLITAVAEIHERRMESHADAPDTKQTSSIDEEDIVRGLEANEFVVHYQPQIDLDTAAWVGMEALVRWQHPTLGMLYPDQFIDTIEKRGLGMTLTRAVLKNVLTDYAHWGPSANYSGTIAINLPPAALTGFDFPEEVMHSAEEFNFPAEKLVFELTETSVAADPVSAADVLTRLRLNAMGLAIDDFGTGHSSLEQLRLLPFTELKIDQSFVQAIDSDVTASVIVKSAIKLGHELNLQVVAEGVENWKIYNWLRNEQCDVAQGWVIAKAMSCNDISVWADKWKKRTSHQEDD